MTRFDSRLLVLSPTIKALYSSGGDEDTMAALADPNYERSTENAAGIHADIPFLRSLREELESLQAKVPSEEIKQIYEGWPQVACSCNSEDGTHTDVEDSTYCWNASHGDVRFVGHSATPLRPAEAEPDDCHRTYTFLEPLLSILQEIGDIYMYQDMIDRIADR